MQPQDTEHIVVVGLGFGDEGKGTIVDALVQHRQSRTVVRFNGGPQAAHHVVCPTRGLHCFSQFGAASLQDDVTTQLSHCMMVEPFALCREAEELVKKGVVSPLSRMQIDSRCVVITPFHKWLNRIQESARGDERHGSCGLGVGQAYMDTLQPGYPVLRVKDLLFPNRVRDILSFLSMLKRDIAEQIAREHPTNESIQIHWEKMSRPGIIDSLVAAYFQFANRSGVQIYDTPGVAKVWERQPGPVVWEGAQGVLLDAERGFWPHVTPSRTTPANANEYLQTASPSASVERIGVLRAYSSRHGAGPFVTESSALTSLLPEMHNGRNDWQGGFRVGWFDAVMARYALQVSETIDSIALTQLDRLVGMEQIQVCVGYRFDGPTTDELSHFFVLEHTPEGPLIRDIRVPQEPCRIYQTELTCMLQWCRPVWKTVSGWQQEHLEALCMGRDAGPLDEYIMLLEAEVMCPITILSAGPTAQDKYHRLSGFTVPTNLLSVSPSVYA